MKFFLIDLKCASWLDLRRFPFDENPVKLQFISDHKGEHFVFSDPPDPSTCLTWFIDPFEIPEFDLVGYSIDNYQVMSQFGKNYAYIDFWIHIRRSPLYYSK